MGWTVDVAVSTVVVMSLCIWRVTHLVGAEDGPWGVLEWVRGRLAARTRLFECFYCLSLWVAAIPAFVFAQTWPDRAVLWLASSGGAIVLQRLTSPGANVVPVAYREE